MPSSTLDLSLEWEDLDKAFEELEAECTQIVRGLTVYAWNLTLKETPQLFGRLVASWTYSINYPVFANRARMIDLDEVVHNQVNLALTNIDFELDIKDDRKMFVPPGIEWGIHKGYKPNIDLANFYSEGKDLSFKLGDTVYFSNGAEHGEGEYGGHIEEGLSPLRVENQPGRMAARALHRVGNMWREGMKPASAEALKALHIESEGRELA